MTEVVTQLELDEINRKREANFLPRLSMSQARRLSLQRESVEKDEDSDDNSLTNFLLFVTVMSELDDSASTTTIQPECLPDNSQFTDSPDEGDFSGGGASGSWADSSTSDAGTDSFGGGDSGSSDGGVI